ncbi:MAG: pantetheine-phosphate adenylyltransferase [Proteobacteria bacterium]|nr:pantetheine-phosphate adenylyltransferase [Pseudomonadota bacterium]
MTIDTGASEAFGRQDDRLAVYAGTFDPPTFGHIDLIRRASRSFGHVIAAIGVNPGKKVMFSTDERLGFLRTALADLPNVSCSAYSGLLVDYCRQVNARVIIRGLRAVADFEYEFQMALANRDLAPEIETVFLIAATDKLFLSSSVVKEIASYGRDVSQYVPPCVAEAIHNYYHKE